MKLLLSILLMVLLTVASAFNTAAASRPEMALQVGGTSDQGVFDASFTHNGRFLLTVYEDGAVAVWTMPDLRLFRRFSGRPDSCLLADISLGKPALPESMTQDPFLLVNAVEFADPHTLVITYEAEGIVAWNFVTGVVTALSTESTGHQPFALSPDRSELLCGNWPSTLSLWKVGSWKRLWSTSNVGSDCFAFSPEGSSIESVSSNSAPSLFAIDPVSGKSSGPDGETPSCASAIAFFPDGTRFVIGDQRGYLSLWNEKTQEMVQDWETSCGDVNALAFSPDGKTLAAAGNGQTVELYDAATFQKLATLLICGTEAAPSGVYLPSNDWIAYTPDHYYNCSPGASKYIDWLENGKLYPASTFEKQFHRPDLVRAHGRFL